MASPISTVVARPHDLEPLTLNKWPSLPASAKSLRTRNPIRAIVDPIVANINNEREDGKEFISLALGDPTAAGNLPPCPAVVEAIQATLATPSAAAGYVDACGTLAARQAIATHHSTKDLPVVADQVIIANGCSGALELALTALLDSDSVLLVPSPGFPLYQVICESHGAQVVHYKLKGSNWQCDLDHLRQLYQEYGPRIRGLLVNNPSNPTGAVFSKHHLEEIVEVCRQFQWPIIADEIYGDLTFGDSTFHPIAPIANTRQVPVITASGLGKQYLVPGWRAGWLVFQDNEYGSLQQVQAGAKRLAQVILGASHLVQTAIGSALAPSNAAWKESVRQTLEHQSRVLCTALNKAPGLQVNSPGGAMYAMVSLNMAELNIPNDMMFAETLLREENVFVLPGSCFGIANAFRVVYCGPPAVLEQAAQRIVSFCQRHQV